MDEEESSDDHTPQDLSSIDQRSEEFDASSDDQSAKKVDNEYSNNSVSNSAIVSMFAEPLTEEKPKGYFSDSEQASP